jgi:quercetin dioxygenase-like cupin family protein
MHHTDTVDFDLVVEGTIELILDDGAHALQSGDCVFMTGVDHGWRAGPAGCILSGTSLGCRRRDELRRHEGARGTSGQRWGPVHPSR